MVERLIEAAVQLFSRQGFRGTTTRQIARLADVNETTLFRHFSRKQTLFWAAVESRLKRLRIPRELQNALLEGDAPERVLPLIVEFLVLAVMYQPELMRLLWVSLLELRLDADRICRQRLEPVFHVIHDYIEHSVASGALRSVDPSLATIAVAATILAHQELHPMLSPDSVSYAKADEAAMAYSRFWLDALVLRVDANHHPEQ